jgi:hypothetical protein
MHLAKRADDEGKVLEVAAEAEDELHRVRDDERDGDLARTTVGAGTPHGLGERAVRRRPDQREPADGRRRTGPGRHGAAGSEQRASRETEE